MANSDHYGIAYLDPNFRYQDGQIGKKIFVVLCTSPLDASKIVVVRTTSKERGAKSYGCHLDDRWQNFFIPNEAKVFNLDTWIMLDYAVEYIEADLGAAGIGQVAKLGPITFSDLLACAAQATDIEQDIRTALRDQL